MRLIGRLILLAALAAGAAYLKQLLEEQAAPAREPDRPPAAPTPAPANPTGTSSSNGSKGSTKAELYEEAQRLGIEGRSKMSKAELERAIRAAG